MTTEVEMSSMWITEICGNLMVSDVEPIKPPPARREPPHD